MKLETFTAYTPLGFLILLAICDPAGSLAAAGRTEPASTSSAALTEERVARPPATFDLGEWVGVYLFSEFFEPDEFFEYRIVIQDPSGTSLIIGNGHMTCDRLNGIAKAAGANKVNIYYESDAVGCPESRFPKGNLLLSIEKASKGYVLRGEDLPVVAPSATVYREDQGISEDGKKLEGPYWGEGFCNHVSLGGACGYDVQYLVFYNINPPTAAQINSVVRAAAGVPSYREMEECDEAHPAALTPPHHAAETGPRYCKGAGLIVVYGDRIARIEVQLFEGPCDPSSAEKTTFSEQRLTVDLKTGTFSN